MTLLMLLCALTGFALFGLADDDHHKKRTGRFPSKEEKRRLRTGGWIAIGAALPVAIMARGWIFGPVWWFAAIMLGAGIVFLWLNLFVQERSKK